MLKKLLAVSLVVILLLTGCNYTEAWAEILNGDIVNTSFELSYQMDEEWASYYIDEAEEYGGEEDKVELQEQLGYNKATVNVALDYKKRLGQIEVIIFNTFNPEKTKTMNFYVQGAKIFVPAELVTEGYMYYWTKEENKRIKEVVTGEKYVMFDMNEGSGYHYDFQRMIMGNTFIWLGEEKGEFEEIFWTKKGGELRELVAFFKNMDMGIKKEGAEYNLNMSFLEAFNQSEKVAYYMIDNVQKEHKPFINRYYDLDDEEFEDVIANKDELKRHVQSSYYWMREVIEGYGLKPIFEVSTINTKWYLTKGANQEVEIKVIVPADIIKKHEIDGPKSIPFTATAKCIQNINKISMVNIQMPSQYLDGNKLYKIYEEIEREHQERYEEESKKRELIYNTQVLSYVWEKGVYYYSADDIRDFFEENLSYNKGKLYLVREDKNIEVKHKIVNERAYIEEAVIKNLGYGVEFEHNADQSTGSVRDSVNYFIISKGNQKLRFAGRPILHLALGEGHEVHRSESDCKDLGWYVIYNGEEVLHGVADNELSFTYYMHDPGQYEIYLTKWITDGYECISNVIRYTIE